MMPGFSESTPRYVVAWSEDATILTGARARVELVNEAAERLLECTGAEATGHPVLSLLGERLGLPARTMHQLAAALESPPRKDARVTRTIARIDDARLVSLNVVFLDGWNAGLEHALVGVKIIAADKKSESIYWESLERVWETQRLSEDILRSIPVAIMICKAAKRGKIVVLDCNFAAEAMTGVKLDRMRGADLGTFWGEARSNARAILEGVGGGGTVYGEEISLAPDGKLKSAYTVQAFPISGGRIGVLFEDITKKQEEYMRLKELDELRNNFIAITSHELKTPLVSTCGAAEFLLSHFKDTLGKEELGLVDLINRGATRLKVLVNSLLDLARLQSGNLNVEPACADIASVAVRVIEDQGYRIKSRSLSVSYDGPGSVPCTCDPLRIEQVLTNLLTNAVKNTPPGGTIKVSVDHDTARGVVRCSVEDSGIGLDADEMRGLFQQFGKVHRDTIDADVDIQGTGLGLFISKQIVDLHGGRIWAESAGRGKGARFTFEIPAGGAGARGAV